MDRRHFLQTTAGAVGAAVLPACGQDSEQAAKSKTFDTQVLVIGAGIAGLAAARSLVDSKYQVTVLEARPDRYGGRLWTSDTWRTHLAAPASMGPLGTPLDLGASWIHGATNNPITALARQLNAITATTSYDRSVLYGPAGQLTDHDRLGLSALRIEIKRAVKAGQNAKMDKSLYDTIWSGTNASRKSAADQGLMRFLMSAEYETEYGGSVSGLGLGSARSVAVGEMSTYWCDYEGNNRLNISGEDKVLTQGFSQIAEHLAKGLSIKLDQQVTGIDYSGARVIVRTSDNSTYTADRVIVTVPLGVLKKGSISFTPALPKKHEEAIKHIGMGVLNKLYMKFDAPFWVDGSNVKFSTNWIESVPPATDSEQTWTEWVSFTGPLKKNVLLGFSAADAALEMEAMSDRQIIDSAMRRLKLIYGNKALNPTHFMRTRWSQDPYTMGSYSFNALGTTERSRSDLATPIDNKLYFAGEATDSDYYGTVHGAYQSGIDTAAKIIKV